MAEMQLPSVWRFAFVVLSVAACASPPVGTNGPSSARGAATTAPGDAGVPTSAGPTLTPSFIRPTPLPAPTLLAYAVKSGDTLTSIARAFGTTPRSIAFWSRDAYPSLDPESAGYEPNRLEIGWVLHLIPGAVFDEGDLPITTPTPTPASPAPTEPSPGASGSAASG